jgi:hypothetical protein
MGVKTLKLVDIRRSAQASWLSTVSLKAKGLRLKDKLP